MNIKNKYEKIFSAILIVLTVLVSSCSTPTMMLQHNSQKGYSYTSRGKIKVVKFEDARLPEEKEEDKVTKTSDKSIILTKKTNPLIDDFLKQAIEDEINKSGLFTVSDDAEYELTGKIISIKNGHLRGVPSKISGGIAVGSILVTTLVSPLYGLVILIPAVVLTAVNKDIINSIVVYEVVLKNNGEMIWNDKINVIVQEKYSTGYKSKEKVLQESAVILDKTITQAIRKMLKEIDKEVK